MRQLALLVLTAAAFLMTTSTDPLQRVLGPCIGIAAQALWILSIHWRTQWGIGIVTLVYLGRYIQLALS